MANDILVKVGADISDFSRKMQESTRALGRFMDANNKTFDSFSKTGKAVTGFGMAVTGGLGVAAKQAIDFESSFAGVRKTVDASEKEFAILEQGIRDMAKELPASVHEINGVAEAAGQLGIKKENILDFTRTMIDLGEATNMTSDEAATSFARFANIVGMSQQDFDKLGSVVVELGNNFATTESEIVEMGMRLAGVGNQVGMTESDIMALATSMSSVGIEAEAGGTAMSTALKKMQNAVSNGGKELDNFAKAAGMSSQEFADAFKKDPIQALDSFIKGLDESGREGENLNEILESVGITGIRESDTLLRLAGASDILSDAVDMASNAWDENTALSDEASQRYETLASKLSILKNTLIDAGISLGSALMPAIESITEIIQKLVEWFNNLDDSTKENIAKFTALAGAIMLVVGPLMMVIGFIPNIVSGFMHVIRVVKLVGKAIALLTSPVGIAIAAVAGLAFLVYKYWDEIKAFTIESWNAIKEFFSELWESIKEIFTAVWEPIKEAWSVTVDWLKELWNGIGEFFSELWQGVTEVFTSFVDGMKEIFSPITEFFSEILGAVSEVFTENWNVLTEFLSQTWDNIAAIASAAWELIKNVILGPILLMINLMTGDMDELNANLQAIWGNIKDAAGRIWGALKDQVSLLMESLGKVLSNIWQGIKNVASTVWNGIKSLVTSLMRGLASVLSSIWNGIKSVASSVWNGIKGLASSIWNGIKETVSNLANKAKEGAIKAWDTLKEKTSEAFNKVVDFIKDPLENIDLFQIGVDIIQGLINGIGSMATAVWDKAKDIGRGIADGVKGMLGIKSPSRVMMSLGKWTSLGLAEGIEDYAKYVDRASDRLAESAVPDVRSIDMSYNTPAGVRNTLSSAVQGTVDVNGRDSALVNAIGSLERRLSNLEVVMDGRVVGRIVEPHVSEIQNRDREVINSFRGRR